MTAEVSISTFSGVIIVGLTNSDPTGHRLPDVPGLLAMVAQGGGAKS